MVLRSESFIPELDGPESGIVRKGPRGELAKTERLFNNLILASRDEMADRFVELCAHVSKKYSTTGNGNQ
jgi:hypothetical protein